MTGTRTTYTVEGDPTRYIIEGDKGMTLELVRLKRRALSQEIDRLCRVFTEETGCRIRELSILGHNYDGQPTFFVEIDLD